MTPIDFDVVVVGSGFGGAIVAWRLASQGRSVLILERGKRYQPGEFPRNVRDARRLFWDDERAAEWGGLFDVRFHSGLGTAVASGVGGGSLVYANNLVRPDDDVFLDWPQGLRRATLEPYFDRVEAVLTPAPVPSVFRLPKRDAFHAAAQALGRPVFDTAQPVSWMTPANPGQGHCVLCAECEFGCNHGAKNTLDFTFLREASVAGAKLWSSCRVSHIEPEGGGGGARPGRYHVRYRDLVQGRDASVAARRVVLAAGTLGTNEILLRSRDVAGSLPDLAAPLGHGFSSNGDFLGTLEGSARSLDPWYGPDVTSVMKFEAAGRTFTLAAPTFNAPTMRYIAALGQGREHHGNWFKDQVWRQLGGLMHAAFDSGLVGPLPPFALPHAGSPERASTLFALGRDSGGGQVVLKDGKLDVLWNYAAENRALIEAMQAAMRDVAAAYGGTFAPLATWDIFEKPFSVHPLGGCALADSPSEGVVDLDGQVFNYPGLHVADGSVIPHALGFHPALTISAVALKIADAIVRKSP